MKKEESGKKSPKGASRSKPFITDERVKFVFGILITGFALYLLIACIAYLLWWKTDLSIADTDIVSGAELKVKNWSGKSGFWLAKMIIGYGFGLGAFFIPLIIGAAGLSLLNFPGLKPGRLITRFALAAILSSLILGFIFGSHDGYLMSGPGGAQGYEITRWLNAFMGKIGTGVILLFLTVSYLIFALHFKPESFRVRMPASATGLFGKDRTNATDAADATDTTKDKDTEPVSGYAVKDDGNHEDDDDHHHTAGDPHFTVRHAAGEDAEGVTVRENPLTGRGSIIHEIGRQPEPVTEQEGIPLNINKPDPGEIIPDHIVDRMLENYDPRLDLSHYKFPPVSILREHKSESAFDNTEVFENKENIIKTLGDHKISIKHISATVGPTVTLYELVPERGVRLARIKSLENDIALNLSALGIRI
ncbi:MAG: DNA translocase FtsK 4TM domain-containing protein, partial [Bacteroidales bacterium]|nr:DNA translocase FtsK 4TM domain-containing protein [Bacteroidales bacterium]